MNSRVFDQIIQLNKDFYEKVGEDFSSTRQSPWKGWSRVIEVLKNHFQSGERLKILDIGCGNGRLYSFLEENLGEIDYAGLDSSKILLEDAKAHYPAAAFKHYDVIKKLDKISDRYDIVTAFGITHHIPSKEFRIKWFKNLANLVKPGGLLIFTIWDFYYDDNIRHAKTYNPSMIDKNELEEGDYFLSWDHIGESALRYCHDFSDDEISSIKKSLENSGMQFIDFWRSDGRDNISNEYFIARSTVA